MVIVWFEGLSGNLKSNLLTKGFSIYKKLCLKGVESKNLGVFYQKIEKSNQ